MNVFKASFECKNSVTGTFFIYRIFNDTENE